MNIALFDNSLARTATRQYVNRVIADGGIIQSERYVFDFYRLMYRVFGGIPRRVYSDLAGVKLNNVAGTDYVQTRYDMNISSPIDSVQTTAANQPLWGTDVDTSFRVSGFDGSNDFHSVNDLGIFNNQGVGSLYSLAKDTNRLGGDAGHIIMFISRADNAASSRAALQTLSATSQFSINGRRLDAGGLASVTPASSDGVNSLVGFFNWSGNLLTGILNSVSGTANFGGGGLTTNADSLNFSIGAINSTTGRFSGIIPVSIADRSLFTTAQITALNAFNRRYFPTLP
jgi:hypothetical protein